MNLVYLGEVTNTHGLKGEIRILSDFKYKKQVFKPGKKLYIMGNELIINTYRVHKEYDMATFKDLNTIEDVLMYKGESVYINRDDYKFRGYLDEDLIGLDVFNEDKCMGKVISILKGKKQDVLVVENGKKHMIPNVKEFVKKVDLENNRIEINYIKGLVDED